MHLQKEAARLLGCFAAACIAPAVAQAQSAESQSFWSLQGGFEYTDNVGRASIEEESETVGVAAFALQLNTDRPRLDAEIGANLEYRDYLDQTFDSELVGGVDGLVSFAFIPERFTWVITENFGQIANERTVADSPDNRQNVNYFSTGPDIMLPLGGRTLVQLSGRYSDTYYENTPEDHEALTGWLALIRQLSETSSVSLNGSTTDIEYDDEAFAEYQLEQVFLRWSTVTERTTFILDGGYNDVTQDDESADGLLARLELLRAVGARSRVGLSAGTEFSTSGQGFRRDQELTGVVTGADDAIIAASDPYQLDYAYLSWTTDRERSAFSVVLNARSEAHEVRTEVDRDVYGAAVTLSRQLSRRLDGSLVGRYLQEEFVNTGFKFDEWGVGLGLSWQLSERISLSLRFDHFEGASDDGTRDFDENRAYVGLAYSRGGS